MLWSLLFFFVSSELFVFTKSAPFSLSQCKLQLIYDIPLELDSQFTPPTHFPNTYKTLKELIYTANESVLILTASDSLRALESSEEYREDFGERGNDIFNLLKTKGKTVNIRIVDNEITMPKWKAADAIELSSIGSLKRHAIDAETGIVQHAKLFVIDGKHTLITSANLDHLSLNLKVELGILVSNCPEFAEDSTNIFENIWDKGRNRELEAKYNRNHPLIVNGTSLFTSMSVEMFRDAGREDDLAEMTRLVREAKSFIFISVMDFWPTPDFSVGQDRANISEFLNELSAAVTRGLTVKVMVSAEYPKRRKNPTKFLETLQRDQFDVKVLKFPSDRVLKSRRLHAKYMLTDKAGIISTSNFTPDYFFHDTGLGVVIEEREKKILSEMEELFNFQWNSIYAQRIDS